MCTPIQLYPKGRQVSGDRTGTNTQNTGPSPGHSLLLQVPRGPSAALLPARGGSQAAAPSNVRLTRVAVPTTATSRSSRPAGHYHSGDTGPDTAPPPARKMAALPVRKMAAGER